MKPRGTPVQATHATCCWEDSTRGTRHPGQPSMLLHTAKSQGLQGDGMAAGRHGYMHEHSQKR